ncbi:MAG: PQQ-binding-like beta-propeller repeat protein [Christensenellaceae bacterium]|jgi:outer membrane protein assembly factor BamB|nr:PQQ-binding-like beta-propeller repeat protein [Christensenellaceae bacterium]
MAGRQTGAKRKRMRGGKYAKRRLVLLLIAFGLVVAAGFGIYKLGAGGVAWVRARFGLTQNEPPAAAQPTPALLPPVAQGISEGLAPQQDMQFAQSVGFSRALMVNKTMESSFVREQPIRFGADAEYAAARGITTFGGNHWRNSFTYGEQVVNEGRLNRSWEQATGALATEGNGTWKGTGWTGQPLIIQWSDEVRATLGVYDVFKAKEGFTEVIYPAMDGSIYFLELGTGNKTREPIRLGQVLKGTAMLDPRGYPLLFVGQGIPTPTEQKETNGAWVRAISLIENKEIWNFGGRDPFSLRIWQAFDASPLLSAATDTLIEVGENGVLYTVKLNTVYDSVAGTLTLHPDRLQKYRYTASGYGESERRRWWGMEDSVAAWREYAFFADNGGNLQCVNLNTMDLVYLKDVSDDTDASIVMEEAPQEGTVYLYTANKVSKQLASGATGVTVHRKINAITGQTVWENKIPALVEGGTLATPHVGHAALNNLVIFACADVAVQLEGQDGYGGLLIAYNKATGKEVWRYAQTAGYWSSPVAIYDAQGVARLLQCDRSGMLRMHDAATGDVICEVDLGSRVESTPAVFNNILVVGTQGQYGSGEPQKIIGVVIK